MVGSGIKGEAARSARPANPIAAAVAAFLALCAITFLNAAAAGAADALSEGDRTCLGCHADEALKKELAGRRSLSLHVGGEAFAKSVHGALGCSACHAEVDLKNHPQQARNIDDPRQYSVAMTAVCKGCHEDTVKRHEGSIHAALLKKGNAAAPICTDCHGPHAVSPNAAHRDACLGCHAAAVDTHASWLPNAARHLRTVSCAACHAPAAQPMVELMLYNGVAKTALAETAGAQQFEKLARSVDADGNGLDSMELRKLLAHYRAAAAGTILHGRIGLRAGVEAHDLSDKSKALRECVRCHSDGAPAFQRVAVSIIGVDGKPLRHEAHKEVLTSVFSVDSVRGFYVLGGTRIGLLDFALLLAVLGGLAVPIGHQAMKALVSKRLRRDGEAHAPDASQPPGPASPEDRSGGRNEVTIKQDRE